MPRAEFFARLGLFIQRDALAPEECRRVIAEMETGHGRAATVDDERGSVQADEAIRRARTLAVSDPTRRRVACVLEAALPQVAARLKPALLELQEPQFLAYRTGDFYRPHRDRSDATEASGPVRVRRATLVLFLNQDFDGGELVLYGLGDGEQMHRLGFPLVPEAGLLLGFPADLVHEVAPVRRGERYSIVAWGASRSKPGASPP